MGLTRPIERLGRRLLRLPLFAKILIANCTIVALGATVGTYITTVHVLRSPHGNHFEMMVLLAGGGLGLSLVLNALVLRTALLPLARLERTARDVLEGRLDARARLGLLADPGTDRLAATFNAMLDSLQQRSEQLQRYSDRLQELSDRILLAQEDERHRLARELHDETGQLLSTLLLHLRLFRTAVGQSGPEVDRGALEAQASMLSDLAREAVDGVRRLALDLRPRALEDLGLAAALNSHVKEWSAHTGTPVHLDLPAADVHVRPTVELAIFRLVQEALNNVARHAHASRVEVSLRRDGGSLVAEVRDNGAGIAAEGGPAPHHEVSEADLVTGGLGSGLGLFSMRERVALAGGYLQLESAPGEGTTVRAVFPRTEPPAGGVNGSGHLHRPAAGAAPEAPCASR